MIMNCGIALHDQKVDTLGSGVALYFMSWLNEFDERRQRISMQTTFIVSY